LFIVIGIVIMSLGLSLFTVANGNFVMTSAPREYMGVVSALTNIARTTGFSIATAFATATFSLFFGYMLSTMVYFDAYTSAFKSTIWAFSIFIIIACIITLFRGFSPTEEKDGYLERVDV
jgi:MFS family permease